MPTQTPGHRQPPHTRLRPTHPQQPQGLPIPGRLSVLVPDTCVPHTGRHQVHSASAVMWVEGRAIHEAAQTCTSPLHSPLTRQSCGDAAASPKHSLVALMHASVMAACTCRTSKGSGMRHAFALCVQRLTTLMMILLIDLEMMSDDVFMLCVICRLNPARYSCSVPSNPTPTYTPRPSYSTPSNPPSTSSYQSYNSPTNPPKSGNPPPSSYNSPGSYSPSSPYSQSNSNSK